MNPLWKDIVSFIVEPVPGTPTIKLNYRVTTQYSDVVNIYSMENLTYLWGIDI